MGLKFPEDLAAWQRWQEARHPARALKGHLRPTGPGPLPAWITTNTAEAAEVVVTVESQAASSVMAVVEPVRHLAGVPLAVVSPFELTTLPGWNSTRVEWFDPARDVPEARLVLSAGQYLPLGAALHAEALRRGVPYVIVQHGLLTPSAPPLPPGSHLFAWSEADSEFWRSGRTDVTVDVVGSQLLWNAAHQPPAHVSRFTRPTWLGQLHGAELSRLGMTRAATGFCLREHATYRPHPSERDRLSRLTHAAWERAGIEIDRSGTPLFQTNRPVVSAFSTGLVEAAARGIPAWTHYPHPPAWLREFWQRYGLRPWGGEPTPAPALPAAEPAAAIAQWVGEHL